jgi:Transposase DDE domain
VVQAFQAAYRLGAVTVVADAGMLSESNLAELEDPGLRFIVGMRIAEVPYQVAQWRRQHPGEPIPDGQVFQPWAMGPKADQPSRTIFYQYRADRARRTLRGISQQISKAENAVAGQKAVKRNRFVQLTGATKTINRELEASARARVGLKGYITNLEAPTAESVMGAYLQLWQIEKSFRMSKSDLRARPIYDHKRDSIEAHLAGTPPPAQLSTPSEPQPLDTNLSQVRSYDQRPWWASGIEACSPLQPSSSTRLPLTLPSRR